jgi:hypothetical protein
MKQYQGGLQNTDPKLPATHSSCMPSTSRALLPSKPNSSLFPLLRAIRIARDFMLSRSGSFKIYAFPKAELTAGAAAEKYFLKGDLIFLAGNIPRLFAFISFSNPAEGCKVL